MLADQQHIRNPQAYEAYLDFIRLQPCIICGGKSEPHHVLARGAHGDNYYIISLCRIHHSHYHAKGRDRFSFEYNVDIYKTMIKQMVEFVEEIWTN